MKNKRTVGPEKVKLMFNASLILFALSTSFLIYTLFTLTPHKTHQTLYKQGSEIVNGQAKFSITDLSYSNGSGIYSAPTEKHYAIFSFNVENISDKPINILPSTDIYMKNGNGDVSFSTPYGLEKPFRAGELMPHEKINGQLSFLVAKNEAQKLYIDAVWSGALIAIAIN